MAGRIYKYNEGKRGRRKKAKKLIQSSTLERRFEGRDASAKGNALKNYALYGQNAPLLKRSTISEVKKMDTEFLLNQINNATKMETTIFYTGTHDINKVKKSSSNKISFIMKN